MQIILYILLGLGLLIAFILWSSSKYEFTYSGEFRVKASPSTVCSILTNEDQIRQWLKGPGFEFQSLGQLSGKKIEVGSQASSLFEEHGRQTYKLTETLTNYEENNHIGFDIESRFATFHVDYNIEQTDGVTLVKEHICGSGNNLFAKVMLRLSDKNLRLVNERVNAQLKQIVEESIEKQNNDHTLV